MWAMAGTVATVATVVPVMGMVTVTVAARCTG